MDNMLDYNEYNALDYHMTYAKLYDSGLYLIQEPNRGDYFVDEEEDCEYSLEEGLKIIVNTIVDTSFKEYPKEVQNDLYKLYKDRLNISII